MPISVLKIDQVIQRTGMSRSSIYVKISRGEFPRQIKLGERAAAWVVTEVEQWIIDRITERDRK